MCRRKTQRDTRIELDVIPDSCARNNCICAGMQFFADQFWCVLCAVCCVCSCFCFRVRLSTRHTIHQQFWMQCMPCRKRSSARQYWRFFFPFSKSELLQTKHECVRYKIPIANRHTQWAIVIFENQSTPSEVKPASQYHTHCGFYGESLARSRSFSLLLRRNWWLWYSIWWYACNIGSIITCMFDWMCSQRRSERKPNQNRRREQQAIAIIEKARQGIE